MEFGKSFGTSFGIGTAPAVLNEKSVRPLGRYTVDFNCADTSEEVSVFMVKAIDGPAAEVKARRLLSPAFTWTCTAIDRVSDA